MEVSPSETPGRVGKLVEGMLEILDYVLMDRGDLHETDDAARSGQVRGLLQKAELHYLTLLVHTKTSRVTVIVDISRAMSAGELVYIIRHVVEDVSSTWTLFPVFRPFMEVSEAAVRNVSALPILLSPTRLPS
jgi:hypothetical protein